MIRQLTVEEVGLCIEGGKTFFSEGKIPGGFTPEVFCRSWKSMITAGFGSIHGSFADNNQITGAIGAVVSPNPNSGKLMGVELFWFVIPQFRGHGIRLLKAYEAWAISKGATLLSMIHLTNLQPDRLKKLYENLGYHEIETNYLKEVA